MSDSYSPMGHAATMLCHDCGAVVYWDKDHDAFHARIDRLERYMGIDSAPEPDPMVMQTVPVPDPEPPFPMGAKVRVVGWRFNEGTVTGWDFYPAWGRWLVRVDNGDDAGGSYALRDPDELELVPENPDTPPSAENPDKPLVCAVCGERVHRVAGAIRHAVVPVAGPNGDRFDHAATLTPPDDVLTISNSQPTEPTSEWRNTCSLCGHIGAFLGGSVTEYGAPTKHLCHGCDEGHDCYRRWTVYAETPDPVEPPVGSGWFADKWPGVPWVHSFDNDWFARIEGEWTWKSWPELLPGRPAVPGIEPSSTVEASPKPDQTEPPVGSVVRCEGCGNVFVRKADGWVNTDDDSRGLAWVGLAAPACGPLRVIYRPGGER